MEQAIERLRSVPESDQDQLARFHLGELEDDARGLRSTAANEDKLNRLVSNMLADDA
jgi:hypothetical protein